MSLRSSILSLAVGSAVAVLLLLTVPVALTTAESESDEAVQGAATLVQGVADFVSTGTADRDALEAVVERANGRRNDTPLTVVLSDGSVLGSARAGCTTTDSDGDDGDADGRGDNDGGRPGRSGDLEDLLPISEAEEVDVDGGEVVRVTATDADGEVVVCAYVSDAQVREEVVGRLGVLAAAALAVLVVVAVAALVVARRLSRHLLVATATADRLSQGDLEARVPDAGPVEVRRVGAALNRLAGRIDELLTLERETAADLSHRLRTPLMAVRLDVDALPLSPARTELDEHLNALERTLTAVIAAARRPQREGAIPGCDAVDVVRGRLAYWSPLLEDQGRPVSMVIDVAPFQGPVRCADEDLAHTLDALIENVVSHTPEGAAVEVRVGSAEGGWVHVEVRDQGTGVPAAALQRGRSDRGSSGLGLDIARACAESTGGRLELDRVEEWAVVRLVLGPNDSQPNHIRA